MTLRESVSALPRSYQLVVAEKTPAITRSYTETYVVLDDVLALLEAEGVKPVTDRMAVLAALRQQAASTQRFALNRAWMNEWNALSVETRAYVAALDGWFEEQR